MNDCSFKERYAMSEQTRHHVVSYHRHEAETLIQAKSSVFFLDLSWVSRFLQPDEDRFVPDRHISANIDNQSIHSVLFSGFMCWLSSQDRQPDDEKTEEDPVYGKCRKSLFSQITQQEPDAQEPDDGGCQDGHQEGDGINRQIQHVLGVV